MAIDLGPRLGLLTNADIGEAYYDQFRPFLQAMDALIQCSVINSVTLTPPASPSSGDAYLLIGAPTGAWLGHGNDIAVFNIQITDPGTDIRNPGWDFYSPNAGWIVWNSAAQQFYVFSGTAWNPLTVPNQVLFSTNGNQNPTQNRLNLIAGENVTLGSDNQGNVTVNSSITEAVSAAFSAITSGISTSTPMVVGNGSSLTTTGSGVISATEINGIPVPDSVTALASNATGQLIAATVAGSGLGLTTGPTSTTAGDLVTFATKYGDLADSGVSISDLVPANSPIFTGVPTAPTAAPGTDTTQLATTAFVEAAVATVGAPSFADVTSGVNDASLVVGSGGNLSVSGTGIINATELGGLSITGVGLAIPTGPKTTVSGDVVTFTGTAGQIADSNVALSSLAPLTSPALTGVPTAPTATVGTNTTQIATTAFVETAIGVGVPTSFAAITSNTNTSATMTVGTGSTLTTSGSGVINATELNGSAVPASAPVLATNSSGQLIEAVVAGSGAGITTGPTSTTLGDIATFATVHGDLEDSGILLSSLAPLASPGLTGTPTAPTATAGTSTTQIATTAFVENAIGIGVPTSFAAITTATNTTAALVVGSGSSLSATGTGTISATSLNGAVPAGSGAGLTTGPTTSATGNIATFTGTHGQIQDSGTALSSLALLASPAFTGTPTAPTAAAGTNTTQLATTAFVEAAVATGAGSSFTSISSGTNTTANMIVGTGASIGYSGTGVVDANYVNAQNLPTSAKAVATNSSAQLVAATLAGAGAGLTTGPTTSVSGDVATFTSTTGQIADSGVLLSNVARTNVSNTFVQGSTFENTLGLSTGIAATSTNNYPSPALSFSATYWDGFESQTTEYALTYSPATGTSPLCTLALTGGTPLGGFLFSVPTLGLSNATTATSATAGSASALPSLPLGFVEIVVNGTTVKIPYYSV